MKLTEYQKSVIIDGAYKKREEVIQWLGFYTKYLEKATKSDFHAIEKRIKSLENKLTELEDLKIKLEL